MSSIGGVSGGLTAWQNVSSNSTRGAERSQRMFAKVDTNGDGSVDSSELQGMLDKMAQRSGGTAANAADTLKTMDSDGNGSLSADELDAGMKSLMPAPSSTMDFAQQRGDDSVQGHDGPPPPWDSSDATGSTSGTSSSDSADGLQSLLANLFQAADADGNGKLDKSEIDTLKTNFDAAIKSMTDDTGSASSTSGSTSVASSDSTATGTSSTASSSSGSTSSDSGTNTSGSSSDPMMATLTALANLVLKEYASTAASSSTTQTASISLSA